MKRRKLCLTGLAVAALAAFGGPAAAEWKPKRPVTLIVPFAAGGGADAFARAVADGLKDILGQPVVITNKPGSGGIIGATEASHARPDGLTLMVTTGGSFVMGWLFRDTPVNPFDHFETVAQIGVLNSAIAVPASSPFQTAQNLVAHATENPGALRWGHTGRGTAHHVAAQSFLDANGIEAVDLPFKGGANVRAAVIGEQVDFASFGVQQARGFEKEMRVLGVISDKRDALQTDIPTMEEQGLAYVQVNTPVTMHAPKGTDPEVIATLEAALEQITASPEFAATMADRGNSPDFLPGTQAEAALERIRVNAQPVIDAVK